MASSEKIEKLKKEIKSGTYKPDIETTAEKMILLNGYGEFYEQKKQEIVNEAY